MLYIIGIVVVGIILYFLFGHKKKQKIQPKPEFILTEEFREIIDLLKNTSDSVYITGKAGTGKSSLLQHFIKHTEKRYVVLAPTGIAALNIGGQTAHSFFRFPPRVIIANQIQPDYVRAELFNKLQMVIIDEVSMVRSDLMDGIDVSLRKNRNRLNEPFGGVQMVFIGDLFQLPPVLVEQDRNQILTQYKGEYFFDAPVFRDFSYHFKELTKVFRQSEEQTKFKNMLNNIRNNTVQFDDMTLLNSRHRENVGEQDNSVFLTTRKNIARNINNEKLEKIVGEQIEYTGTLLGKFEKLRELDEDKIEDNLPAPYKLKLKKNVQVMMLKNDPGKRWVNGSIGKVSRLKADGIWINLDGQTHKVEKETWREVKYELNKNTNEIEAKVSGEFCQYPIRPSYAMTIHKSQGKTFERITIDIGTGAFAHGQIYIALSRCKTLDGIILNNQIRNTDIIVDPRVVEFYNNRNEIPSPNKTILASTSPIRKTIEFAIANNKKVNIIYEKYNGELSKRLISHISMCNEFGKYGYIDDHINALCHLRDEERKFKIDRIKHIEIVE